MPTEIFISYRRSDTAGHARAIGRDLMRYFDKERVFYDRRRLEPGIDFSADIVAAVKECAVLLALIGPDWASASREGRPRLFDDDDFVCLEIGQALALGKYVIPVLLDGAGMPTRDVLPEVLHRLCDLQFHEQGGSDEAFDASLARLVDKLARRPGVSPPHPLAAERNAPVDTAQWPALCDRDPQNRSFVSTLRQELMAGQRRPFVVVVHGPVTEAPDVFVTRIERQSLPDVLVETPFARNVRFVHVKTRLEIGASQAEFDAALHEQLRNALRTSIQEAGLPWDQLLAQRRISTLVVVLTWRSAEIARSPEAALEQVRGFWERFPATDANTLLGCVVCLKYDEPSLVDRFFRSRHSPAARLRRAVEASTQASASSSVAWHVTREMSPVTFEDVDEWVGKISQFVPAIFSAPDDTLREIVGGAQAPMQVVLPRLHGFVDTLKV